MKRAAALLLAALALAAGGCLDTKQEYTLNPDGSGKVVVESLFPPVKLGLGDEAQSPATVARDAARAEVDKAAGVEVWKDLSFRQTDDGRVWFKGTAYFTNLARLKLHNNGFDARNLHPTLTRDDRGDLVLELGAEARRGLGAAGSATPAPLPESELAAKVQAERAKYQQMHPLLLGFFANLRVALTFHLPSAATTVVNFQKVDPQTVAVTFTGAKMLATLDAVASDNAWWRAQVLAGRDLAKDGPDPALLNEKVFGQPGPVRAVFRPAARPLFDYQAETAAAKQAYPKLLESLSIPAALAAPAVAGGSFQRLRVGGIRLVTIADSQRGVRPFNAEAGCTLALVGDLPGAALAVGGGQLEKAVADTGDDLLPERDADRQITAARLSRDKTTVVFEVKVALPGLGVRALRELAGTLQYLVGGPAKEVDLGITEFAAGSRGQRYDATIQTLAESPWQPGRQQLELQLALLKPAVKSVTFYDAEGNKLDASAAGATWTDQSTTMGFTVKGKFPPRGRVVAEIYELEKRALPFALTNVSLVPATAQP